MFTFFLVWFLCVVISINKRLVNVTAPSNKTLLKQIRLILLYFRWLIHHIINFPSRGRFTSTFLWILSAVCYLNMLDLWRFKLQFLCFYLKFYLVLVRFMLSIIFLLLRSKLLVDDILVKNLCLIRFWCEIYVLLYFILLKILLMLNGHLLSLITI